MDQHLLTETSDAPGVRGTARQGVALELAAAAGLHLAALSGHLQQGVAVATFFLFAAALQLAAAVLVHRRIGANAAVAIAVANIGLIVLWALSRTVGVPGGAHGGAPEPVGLLDTLAVVTEGVAVAGLFVLARRTSPASPSPRRGRSTVVLTACVVGAAALLLAPAPHGHHRHAAPSTPAVARVDPLTPAMHAPDAPPADQRAQVDTTPTDAGCANATDCGHPHRHGDHGH